MDSAVSLNWPRNVGVQMGANYGNTDIRINNGNPEATQNQQCLRDLRVTNPRDDKTRIESFKGGLLKDSYVWVLKNEEYLKWQHALKNGENGSEQFRQLWIKADPGKGKTMLLCGIIDELKGANENATVISFFFCQADQPELRSATYILRGLIFMLVEDRSDLLSYVRRRWDQEGRNLFEDKNAWVALSNIFLDILKDQSLRCVVLIVDALDECTSGRSQFIDLLKKSSAIEKVKWIVSSRNWLDIEEQFRMHNCSVLSLEMNQHYIANSVKAYIQFKVDELTRQKHYDIEVTNAVQSYLTLNSNDTFLWVALVCEQLFKASNWRAEEKLRSFPTTLNDFYQRMIGEIGHSEDAQLCKEILATVTTAFRPLTLTEIAVHASLPAQVTRDERFLSEIVKLCGSFLSIRDNVVFFIHQSAKDFLWTNQSLFPSGTHIQHRSLLNTSLQTTNRTLRQNIWRIQHPGHSVDEISPPTPDPLQPAQYACVYWIDHLISCEFNFDHDVDRGEFSLVESFLYKKLLHWLEALSLLRYTWRGFKGILDLDELLRREARIPHDVKLFVSDLCIFLRRHRPVMESCPLQVYSSSLIFSPDCSEVKRIYADEKASWIIKEPTVEDPWTPLVHVIGELTDPVIEMAWSLEYNRLLTVTYDFIINTWDSSTGHCLSSVQLKELEYPFIEDERLAWSHDRTKVAFMKLNKLMIWDCMTGELIYVVEVDSYHEGHILPPAWSFDGKRLAVNTVNNRDKCYSILFFDLYKHPAQFRMTQLSQERILKISFSRDGNWLFMVGENSGRTCNSRTGTLSDDLHLRDSGTLRRENSCSWSPDTSMVAIGTDFGKIQILDTTDWKNIRTLNHDHLSSILAVGWSQDGSRLAAGAVSSGSNYSIQVWNSITGDYIYNLLGNSSGVEMMICWSTDGRYLAAWSSSSNATMTYDLTIAQDRLRSDIPEALNDVHWSPDGTRLALGYSAFVQIRDPAAGTLLASLENNPCRLVDGSWNPDGDTLAFKSTGSKTIIIWHVASEKISQNLQGGKSPYCDSVAWSHGGDRLMTASTLSFKEHAIRIWSFIARDQYVQVNILMRRFVRRAKWSLSWSPNDDRAASGCANNIIIFGTATGLILKDLSYELGPNDNVKSTAWSLDGSLFVLSSNSCIKIWDAATWQCLRILHFGSAHLDRYHLDSTRPLSDMIDLAAISASATEDLAVVPIGYGLALDSSWITWKGQNLLWLPLECRPDHEKLFRVSGGRVSIGCSSGRVLVFWLDPNPKFDDYATYSVER